MEKGLNCVGSIPSGSPKTFIREAASKFASTINVVSGDTIADPTGDLRITPEKIWLDEVSIVVSSVKTVNGISLFAFLKANVPSLIVLV